MKTVAPYGMKLVDHSRQMAVARQHMQRLHLAAVAVGATIIQDEVIMTPEQQAEFNKLMKRESPPFDGSLADWQAWGLAAGLEMAYIQRVFDAVGATLAGNGVAMDQTQRQVFEWILTGKTPPAA